MLTAVAFGALGILAPCLVAWRGGAGRLWIFMGMLVLLVAAELDWYGLNHGWPAAHHDVGLVFLPADLVGVLAVAAGLVLSRRASWRRCRNGPRQP